VGGLGAAGDSQKKNGTLLATPKTRKSPACRTGCRGQCVAQETKGHGQKTATRKRNPEPRERKNEPNIGSCFRGKARDLGKKRGKRGASNKNPWKNGGASKTQPLRADEETCGQGRTAITKGGRREARREWKKHENWASSDRENLSSSAHRLYTTH